MAERKRVKAEAGVKDGQLQVSEEDRSANKRRRSSALPPLSATRAEAKPRPTGFCTKDLIVREVIRRVTTTTEYYKDGELMFTMKPVVNEDTERKERDKVIKIGGDKFRMSEAEHLVEEEEKKSPLGNHFFILTGDTRDDRNFRRRDIEDAIAALGGTVVQDFHRLLECEGKRFLLAPRCLSTDKYFQCLAANFPCVSHKWVLDTAEAHATGGYAPSFEKYRLPAGKAKADNDKLVDWKPREKLLDGMGIGLAGDREFLSRWTVTLRAAKANLVSIEGPLAQGQRWPKLDCIVKRGWMDPSVVRTARLSGIPIVKDIWIIQTLINGEKEPFENYIAIH